MISCYFHWLNVATRSPWEGPEFALQVAQQLEGLDGNYKAIHSPENSDLIVVIESNCFKDWRYLEVLRADPLLNKWPERCFCLNYEDSPAGFLSGVYAGLPQSRFVASRHRAHGYFSLSNPDVLKFTRLRDVSAPRLLGSFRGANSHPIRKNLFKLTNTWPPAISITQIDRWFDHSENEKGAYFDELLDSKFVLCPRGIASSSIRLFEVMALGRVPVIISDEWVPPIGPDWSRCSLRVDESRIGEIPEVLLRNEPKWKELAMKAASEYAAWYRPGMAVSRALDYIMSIKLGRQRSHCEWREIEKFNRLGKRWQMGWTLPQRLRRRLTRTLATLSRDGL